MARCHIQHVCSGAKHCNAGLLVDAELNYILGQTRGMKGETLKGTFAKNEDSLLQQETQSCCLCTGRENQEQESTEISSNS
eukprot:759439-Hanusia_phi.AAC.4